MTSSERIKLRGVGVSSGIAISTARLYQVSNLDVGESTVLDQNIDAEVERFHDAIEMTRNQLHELGMRVGERNQDGTLSEVLTLHLLLLDDKMIIDRTIELIREFRYGAEFALSKTAKEVEERYSHLPDLFRERFKDVEDICRRILDNLQGVKTQSLEEIEEECIIVAKDLSPSDTASLRSDKVLGFVNEVGGKTSHTAILARALEIPAVVGLQDISKFAKSKNPMIIDGDAGLAIINPTDEDIAEYTSLKNLLHVRRTKLFEANELEPVTLDGHCVELAGNIEFSSEVDSVEKYGAFGVGLFRTEFLFLNRSLLPTEEEQYRHYFTIAERLHPKPVIIRTLDLGGDKFVHAFDHMKELNPFLGCRAIRFCLDNPYIFRTQMRAILRASVLKNVKVMYPLISNCSELTAANAMLEDLKADFREQGIPHDDTIPIGAMIEVPSAVMLAEDMANDLEFFSIGTNDLIQYTLAVDRGNEKISHLYQPLHPAVLRMIEIIVQVGRKHHLPVSVCGEMASDPVCSLVLLALGIERLSMAPYGIPQIKDIVRTVRMDQLREFGQSLLRISTVSDMKSYIEKALPKVLSNREDLITQLRGSSIFTAA